MQVYERLQVGRKCTTPVPPHTGSEVMAEIDVASGAGGHSPRHKRLQEPRLRGRTAGFYVREYNRQPDAGKSRTTTRRQ